MKGLANKETNKQTQRTGYVAYFTNEVGNEHILLLETADMTFYMRIVKKNSYHIWYCL